MSDYAARRVMMVDTQVRPSDVTKFPIIAAMLAVPREVYVPRDKREAAYVGENVEIGTGRVMLEARTLAKLFRRGCRQCRHRRRPAGGGRCQAWSL